MYQLVLVFCFVIEGSSIDCREQVREHQIGQYPICRDHAVTFARTNLVDDTGREVRGVRVSWSAEWGGPAAACRQA